MNAAELIASAIQDLKAARDKLKEAQARKAHAYVNRALKSVEGAQRHARGAPYREERRERKFWEGVERSTHDAIIGGKE